MFTNCQNPLNGC